MSEVKVEKPNDSQLAALSVSDWPVWTKGVSTFDWHYDSKEVAYIIEGKVTVTPNGGLPVSFSAGDLVTFESGLDCLWEVKQALKKHYHFE